jgi:hypothetical protein
MHRDDTPIDLVVEGALRWKEFVRVRLDILGSTHGQVMRGHRTAARRGVSNQ